MYRVLFLLLPMVLMADLKVGLGVVDITPGAGVPSAGYAARRGEPMEGTRDPLYASAIMIDNGEKRVALCSVDHLGFTYQMCQAVAREFPFDVIIGSTHTHSGGGAFLNIPRLGPFLAGAFSPQVTQGYVDGAILAINRALDTMQDAQIGVGLGHVEGVSYFRASCPAIEPIDHLTLIKIVDAKGDPLAGLVNFALHPTVLKADNRYFSADFVASVRDKVQFPLIYFNGAQAEVIPVQGKSCDQIGEAIAGEVIRLWEGTEVKNDLKLALARRPLTFQPEVNPSGIRLPVESYASEVGALQLGDWLFSLVPGELSVAYEMDLRREFDKVAVLGLTGDAHGYLIKPEAWDSKTMESRMSFGGREHGDWIYSLLRDCLREL